MTPENDQLYKLAQGELTRLRTYRDMLEKLIKEKLEHINTIKRVDHCIAVGEPFDFEVMP